MFYFFFANFFNSKKKEEISSQRFNNWKLKNEVQCILSFCIWTIIIYSIIKIISLFKGVICYNYLIIISKYWGFVMRARDNYARAHLWALSMRDFAFRPAGWYFKRYTYINTSINRACLWLWVHAQQLPPIPIFEKKELAICTDLKINTRQGSI